MTKKAFASQLKNLSNICIEKMSVHSLYETCQLIASLPKDLVDSIVSKMLCDPFIGCVMKIHVEAHHMAETDFDIPIPDYITLADIDEDGDVIDSELKEKILSEHGWRVYQYAFIRIRKVFNHK